ncbi:HlyD family secretion protein [Zhongshania arctica]|uniref:HlyD family secretion protein n=1 Tax=Zhongshania arctica TaxID=3238302 RepID=A0ABV3TUS2_9GAMM|tara:strand:+ start:826 stop:1791 length:966 start_codon:yes stop_codon:yes gene_type:complete
MPFFLRLSVMGALLLLVGCESSTTPGGFNGYVEAEYIYVSALEPGWVIASMVKEGDIVEKGQVLLQLDNDRQRFDLHEANTRVLQADAQYQDLATGARPDEINRLTAQRKEAVAARALAEVENRRLSSLREKGVAAQSSVDQATAQFNAADARVDRMDAEIRLAKLASRENTILASRAAFESAQTGAERAQWRLEQRTLYARRAGRVEQVFFREGEQLAAGVPALALLPEDGLKVRFFAAQSQLASFPVGSMVGVRQDGITEPMTALVSYIAAEPEYTPPVIYSVASRQKLVFLIEAKLAPNSGLHPGQPVDVFLGADGND